MKITATGLDYYKEVLNVLRRFAPFNNLNNTEAKTLSFYMFKYAEYKDKLDEDTIKIIFNSSKFKDDSTKELGFINTATFRTFSYKLRVKKYLDEDFMLCKVLKGIDKNKFEFKIEVVNEAT